MLLSINSYICPSNNLKQIKMEKRQIELTIETATRWLNGSDTELKELALQTFPELEKKKMPKFWIDLDIIDGWWVNNTSEIRDYNSFKPSRHDRNIFTTKALAESSISCAMYSQMIKAYRDEPLTDFIETAEKYANYVIPTLELFFGKHAESAFYFGLLLQLRDEVNGDWAATRWLNGSDDELKQLALQTFPELEKKKLPKLWIDFGNTEAKYFIQSQGQKLNIDYSYCISKPLIFQYEETAEKFLTDFEKLLIKAKDLI